MPATEASPDAAVDVGRYLEDDDRKTLLRFITCGSVDDGKSTLIGRLLYDTKQVFDDQLEHVAEASIRRGGEGALDLALLPGAVATTLDTGRRVVTDSAGQEHPYDALVVATGVRPRTLGIGIGGGIHGAAVGARHPHGGARAGVARARAGADSLSPRARGAVRGDGGADNRRHRLQHK